MEMIINVKYLIKPSQNRKYEGFIILGITSTIDSYNIRLIIRDTIFKSRKKFNFYSFFFISNSENHYYNSLLKTESLLYNDIIQFSVIESYFNLTILTIWMIKWVNDNCKYIYFIKNDQDVIPNFKLLYSFLLSNVDNNCSFGIISKNEIVCRNIKSKRYISFLSYKNNILHSYIFGYFAIYKNKLLEYINSIAFITYPIIYKEDVHIGLLASKTNYSFCKMKYRIMNIKKKNETLKNKKHIIAIHGLHNNNYLKYFKQLNVL